MTSAYDRNTLHCLCFQLLFLPAVACADIEIGDAVALADSAATLERKLTQSCDSIATSSVLPPRFPLAENREQHLTCNGYAADGIAFDKAIFTLADNAFVRMEATGVNAAELRAALGEAQGSYLGMEIFRQATIWLNAPRNTLVWISPEGQHPNLFAWRNPHLEANATPTSAPTTALPELIDFTASLEEQMPTLADSCSPLQIQDEDEIWLRTRPQRQQQVNCFNFDYAGFQRKLELVYGDGKLELVWVLTAKPEERRIRELLIEEWGPANIENDTWEVFGAGRISLRKDTPELLILSEDMIPLYREDFDSEARGN